jgi:monovalent cation:H+ antiporter, CPA1 family
LPRGFDLYLSRDLIFVVLLPPLIFEAALQLPWAAFRRELPATLLLAFAGVAIAAAVVACGTRYLIGWSWMTSAFFGTLIAATDPVSVIAAFKEMKTEPRLSLLVESESLLNDGAAAVGFSVLAAIATDRASSPAGMAMMFAWTILGGVGAGSAVAALVLLTAWRTRDHLVEITLTMIAAYGSFILAEKIGSSGVLATLTSGLIIGNFGWCRAISEGGRTYILSVWEFAAFLANSTVFILIGSHEARQSFEPFAFAVAISILLVLAGRAAAVYPLSAVFRFSRLRISSAYQHILFWGGLRGALALALALALPSNIAERSGVIAVTFAVVAFSIFVQGLTTPILARMLQVVEN